MIATFVYGPAFSLILEGWVRNRFAVASSNGDSGSDSGSDSGNGTETPVETPVQTPTPTVTPTATDCSAIPQNCRTTIDELTDATTSEDTDEFIVSRGGETFKVSTYEIISKLLDDNRLAAKIEEIVQSSNTNTDTSNTTQAASIGGYIDVSSPGTTAFGTPTPYMNAGDSFTFPDFDNDTQVIFISYTVSQYVSNAADRPRGQLQPLQVGSNPFNLVPGRNLTAILTAEGLLTVQAQSTAGESAQWMAYRFTRATL